ncbi:hypothetical protein LO772_34755 [Yinghuangia sp. ASG 101]|uniref:hypothetical protein n=1 Tax=Yinghuangia sp. ASG 101 TaxID=2896848 RepID=UPI001E2CAAB3|nr:hypothetical protein [Yinghuangia sp. ASG 101]UGQ11868.1 hypothetical protein LO772_34755 [Yinghuangia sp. ASG 101]
MVFDGFGRALPGRRGGAETGRGSVDLIARFQGLCDAVLFAVECSEDDDRLGALDSVLKPWVRAQIASHEGSMSWCDNNQDVALAVRAVLAIAPQYADLRRELFSDRHHVGRPEAPWRKVGPTLAVRSPLRVWRRRPQYALVALAPDLQVPEARTWEFRVFTAVDEGAGTKQVTTTHRVMTFRTEKHWDVTVQVSPDFEEQRELYEELGYAFTALGVSARLAGIYDPDGGRSTPPAERPPS